MAMNRFLRNIRTLIRPEEEVTLSTDIVPKTYLVVGAETGAGAEICACLAEDKHKIGLACSPGGKAIVNAMSESLIEKGAQAGQFEFVLGNEENIKDVVNGTVGMYNSIDGLVLALEEPYYGEIDDLADPTGVIESVFDTNYYTLVYFTYHALPHLRKSRGKIILLSSFHEDGQADKNSLYYAARGATLAFFETLQEEEPGINIMIVNGPNTHPQEITSQGTHKDVAHSENECVKRSACLVWTASR